MPRITHLTPQERWTITIPWHIVTTRHIRKSNYLAGRNTTVWPIQKSSCQTSTNRATSSTNNRSRCLTSPGTQKFTTCSFCFGSMSMPERYCMEKSSVASRENHPDPGGSASLDQQPTRPSPRTLRNTILGGRTTSTRVNISDSNHGSISDDEAANSESKIGNLKQNLARTQPELQMMQSQLHQVTSSAPKMEKS